jgi:hypothetical protein
MMTRSDDFYWDNPLMHLFTLFIWFDSFSIVISLNEKWQILIFFLLLFIVEYIYIYKKMQVTHTHTHRLIKKTHFID